MLDIFNGISSWMNEGKSFAIATVTYTWGSAPRLVGASLAVSSDMEMIGSVSGGCVEGQVVKAALESLEQNKAQMLDFGIADETAWSVGLSCGGKMGVLIEPFVGISQHEKEADIWTLLEKVVETNQGAVLVSSMEEGIPKRSLIQADASVVGYDLPKEVSFQALKAFAQRKNQIIEQGESKYFATVVPRRSQLIAIGAAHITVDLVDIASQFGFETIVIDPRGIFSKKTQFTTAPDQMHDDWPQEVLENYPLDPFTYAVTLTHDTKIDDPALHILLKSNVAYIGALGSKRTHAKRVVRLQEAGFSEEEIARIHGPIGVNIKAKLPKEIALSIMAEIISVKNQYL